MRVAEIKYYDVANGSGVRTSLFLSGCNRHCKGCFSKETWDFSFGEEFTEETAIKIMDSLKPVYIAGLSVLGGEPVESRAELVPFLKRVKEMYPQKELWLFTGYEWDELVELATKDTNAAELLSLVDDVKAGPFVEELKDVGLIFRGSSNQRIIKLMHTPGGGYSVSENQPEK